MKNPLAAFILALLLLCLGSASALGADYYDVHGHWAEQVIREWSGLDVITGYPDGSFRPNNSITRAEMAVILDRVFEFQGVAANPFRDVPDGEWYANAVLKCNKAGVILGYDGLMRPLDTITREEAAAVISRALGYYDQRTDFVPEFADNDDISEWAWNNVAWLAEHGYVAGSEGRFLPRQPITRAQTMMMLDNLIGELWRSTGLFNQDVEGNMVVAAPRAMFINSHISGDVLVAGGRVEKVILCNCQIDGDVFNTAGAQVQVVDENTIQSLFFGSRELAVQRGAKVNRLRGGDFFINDRGRLDYSGGFVAHGIDVSEWQADINWPAVAANGVDFAIIRCAYRGYSSGNLVNDSRFHQNMQGAIAAGLDVGVYVYSQAISEAEAREEARRAVELSRNYNLTYPIVFDWEYAGAASARTNNTSAAALTAMARAFCEEVKRLGGTPCVYSYSSLSYDNYNLAALNDYYMWMAVYYDKPEYYYHYDMWQYTSSGSVAGIDGSVDMNLSFVGYEDRHD